MLMRVAVEVELLLLLLLALPPLVVVLLSSESLASESSRRATDSSSFPVCTSELSYIAHVNSYVTRGRRVATSCL